MPSCAESESLPQAPGKGTHHQRRERDHGQADQRQLPVEPQQPADQAEHRKRVADQHGQRRGCRRRDTIHVIGDARGRHRGGVGVEVAGRQPHQAFEHELAQVGDHLVRDPGHAVAGEEAGHAAQHEDADDGQRQPGQPALFALAKALVQQRLHQRREQRLGGRRQRCGRQGQGETFPVRAHVGEQTEVQLATSGHDTTLPPAPSPSEGVTAVRRGAAPGIGWRPFGRPCGALMASSPAGSTASSR